MNDIMDNSTAQKLTQFITQIEKLEEDKAGMQEDIKDVFQMAKMSGYDTKIMKIILKLRKKSSDEIDEENTMVEVYQKALGMLI